MKKRLFHIIFIALAFLTTTIAIATGSYFGAGLTMEVGMRSDILVLAPTDVVNEVATEANRETARVLAQGLAQVFTPDPNVWAIVSNNLDILDENLTAIRYNYTLERETFETEFAQWEVTIIEMAEEAAQQTALWNVANAEALAAGQEPPPMPIIPIPPSEPQWEGESLKYFADLPVIFNEAQQTLIVEMPEDHFNDLWDAIDAVAYNIQTQIPFQDITTTISHNIDNGIGVFRLDRASDDLAQHIIMSQLLPNAIPNETLNRQNYEAALANYETVVVHENEVLLGIGWEVTEEIYAMLAQLDMLSPDSILDNLYPMLGVFFLAGILFAISLMYMYFYHRSILDNTKEAALLWTLFTLTLLLVWTLRDFAYPFLPILLFPMLVSILIDRRSATVLSVSLVFILYFVVEGNFTFLLFYAVAGVLIALLSKFTTERAKVILVGLLVSILQFALSVAIAFIIQRDTAFYDLTDLFFTAGFAALNGLLVVILSMGSLPFWETFFGVVTPVKLLDLTNPTNLLLRRLTIEAPGTYHHSLIVANLAETAAYDIGANAHAARVGGYYHDVGKLKFPHYFAENLDGGENPHDHLDPINSAQLIMSHVSYGLTLAGEHRLPQFVRDIIKEHHGTTLMQYFFSKAKESSTQVEEKDFRYPFIIPQSRESACVMLADSVEAAVRSMIPKIQSVDEVEKTIRFIIRGKLNDGQLADSELSIRDVTVIEQSFFRVLKGMYHERIAYPKPEEPAKGSVAT
ncbi:MAG: HDIG domain-containing protein [Defluviitaleaceae bacterium]|nr:HDIG domain-containing protein [Defluviitaleaceae bacterium]